MVFKKIIFQNRYVALETPSRPPPPLANTSFFHFYYLTSPLRTFELDFAWFFAIFVNSPSVSFDVYIPTCTPSTTKALGLGPQETQVKHSFGEKPLRVTLSLGSHVLFLIFCFCTAGIVKSYWETFGNEGIRKRCSLMKRWKESTHKDEARWI